MHDVAMRPITSFRGYLGLALLLGCSSTGDDAVSTALREGELRLGRGDPMGARVAFSAATTRNPKSFIGWIGMARAAAASYDTGEAERALSRALACSPETADALDLSGRTALELARVTPKPQRRLTAQLASSLLARARGFDRTVPNAAYHAGLGAWWSGDLAGAMNWFDEARALGHDPRAEAAVAALRTEAAGLDTRPTSRAGD